MQWLTLVTEPHSAAGHCQDRSADTSQGRKSAMHSTVNFFLVVTVLIEISEAQKYFFSRFFLWDLSWFRQVVLFPLCSTAIYEWCMGISHFSCNHPAEENCQHLSGASAQLVEYGHIYHLMLSHPAHPVVFACFLEKKSHSIVLEVLLLLFGSMESQKGLQKSLSNDLS